MYIFLNNFLIIINIIIESIIMNDYIEAVGEFKMKAQRLFKLPYVSINQTGKIDRGV